jgi:hypothetical protein
VDESETGSANFFGPAAAPVAALDSVAMELPRPPAFSPGFHAFAWGVILGAYVWIGLLAIGTGAGSAFLFGLVAAVLIFFFVRLCGEDQLRRD